MGSRNNVAEPDRPSLAELKKKCTTAWKAWPTRVATQPFKADQWQYFYPCEDPSEFGNTIPLPYEGMVKCIFLGDNQEPLSRKGGVTTITNHLIGKSGGLSSWKPKIGPNAPGFRADLRDEYNRIVSVLIDDRAAVKEANRKRKIEKKARNVGATVSSDAAYAEMAANPSPTAQRAKAIHINSGREAARE